MGTFQSPRHWLQLFQASCLDNSVWFPRNQMRQELFGRIEIHQADCSSCPQRYLTFWSSVSREVFCHACPNNETSAWQTEAGRKAAWSWMDLNKLDWWACNPTTPWGECALWNLWALGCNANFRTLPFLLPGLLGHVLQGVLLVVRINGTQYSLASLNLTGNKVDVPSKTFFPQF